MKLDAPVNDLNLKIDCVSQLVSERLLVHVASEIGRSQESLTVSSGSEEERAKIWSAKIGGEELAHKRELTECLHSSVRPQRHSKPSRVDWC